MSDATVRDVERPDSGGDVLHLAITGDPLPDRNAFLLCIVAAERSKAWARLVRAEMHLRHEEWVSDGEGHAMHTAREEVYSARQAIRDLGVDVDALLEEA